MLGTRVDWAHLAPGWTVESQQEGVQETGLIALDWAFCAHSRVQGGRQGGR